MAHLQAAGFAILSIVLAGCGEDEAQFSSAAATPTPRTAPEQPALAFDEPAAVAANGEYPAADPKTVCGADDRRFLAELARGDALTFKVPKRLADIKPSPSEMLVAGCQRGPSKHV